MTERTLYISNLPPTATEAQLSEMFGRCGTVVSAVITLDASTGRSKRCGFIEMASAVEAMKAIQRLNLTDYDGRLMSVNLANTRDVAASKWSAGPR